MKIGFTGSHGTGKTTTGKILAQRLNVPFISSASRKVNSLGYAINSEATVLSQAATSMARLAGQLDAGPRFVSDRTLVDSMAYNKFQLDNEWSEDPQALFWYETMETITRHTMGMYDVLCYFPIEFPIVGDGVRATDVEYQLEIDSLLIMQLERLPVRLYTVPRGTPLQRAQFVEGILYMKGLL